MMCIFHVLSSILHFFDKDMKCTLYYLYIRRQWTEIYILIHKVTQKTLETGKCLVSRTFALEELEFPISRSLLTSRRRTDELGSRLERPIHFECKLNEPMHIGMRLLHPAAADHSVSISRQQVQRIFSFSLRSRAVLIVLLQTISTESASRLWCWWTAIQRWWSPLSSGLHTSGCTKPLLCCSDHLPCALQHAKRANTSLKECYGWNVFFKTRLFKDALPPVRFWMRSLPVAG